MKILSCSLILSLLSWFNAPPNESSDHEFYFSVATLEPNREAWTVETEFRLFSDDLEKALGESDDYHLRLGDEKEVPEADSLIFDYLFEKFNIEGKGWENAQMNYIGKKVDNDVTFVYVEYAQITHWGEVNITNNIFFDEFEGQQNQISYINGSVIKSETCFREYPKRSFNFGE